MDLWNSLIILLALEIAIAYFTVNLVLFIISSIRKKKGDTSGLALHHKKFKIHLIISSVMLGLLLNIYLVFYLMMFTALNV